MATLYHTTPYQPETHISPRAEGQWAGIRFALLLLRTSARRKKMYENGINLHTHQKMFLAVSQHSFKSHTLLTLVETSLLALRKYTNRT